MIGRSQARCTSTAFAFIATFSVPWTAPNANRLSDSAPRLPAYPGSTSIAASAVAAGSIVRPLPNRSTSRPETCMPTMAPAANASSPTLSWPSLRARLRLTAGMRAVQTPRTPPYARNSTDTATRARHMRTMCGDFVAMDHP
jgi:hypothetical protein